MNLQPPAKTSRLKGWLRRLLVLAVLVVACWFVFERYVLRIDQYRPAVIKAVEDATGLTASIGRIDLDLFPEPHLEFHRISLTDDVLRAKASRIRLSLELAPLLRERKLIVTTTIVEALELRVPRDSEAFNNSIDAIREQASTKEGGSSAVTVQLPKIHAPSAKLYLDDDEEETLTLDLLIEDILAESFRISAKGSIPELGKHAQADATLAVELVDGAFDAATLEVQLDGLDLSGLDIEGEPDVALNGLVTAAISDFNDLYLALSGDILSAAHPSLEGPVTATAHWKESDLHVEGISWKGQGIDIAADVHRTNDATIRLANLTGTLGIGALEALMPMLLGEDIRPRDQGTAKLSMDGLGLEWTPEGTMSATDGTLKLTGLDLVSKEGEVIAKQLQGRVAIDNGTIQIEEFGNDEFIVRGSLRQNGSDSLDATLSLDSDRVSSINATGTYHYASREWRGKTTMDIRETVSALLDTTPSELFYEPLLALYSPAVLDTVLKLPGKEYRGWKIDFLREDIIGFRAAIEFEESDEGGFVLARADAVAPINFDEVTTDLFRYAKLTGQSVFTFQVHAESRDYSAVFDLTDTVVTAQDILTKEAGGKCALSVSGETGSEWTRETLRIDLLGESVALNLGSDTPSPVELNLAGLESIVSNGASAQGRVHGEITLEPFSLSLALDKVTLPLTDGTTSDLLSGGIRYQDKILAVSDLRLKGEDTDCRLGVVWSPDKLEGTLAGKSLNLDTIIDFVDTVEAFRQDETSDATPDESDSPESADYAEGRFVVTLDQIHYRGGHVENAAFVIESTESVVHIPDIALEAYSGNITGAVQLTRSDNAPTELATQLTLDAINMHGLDELLFNESREITGLLNGSIDITAPLGTSDGMLAGTNGTIRWDATKGSLGKLGFATKLLSALKTLEIINLRAPKMKDQGLVFNTFTGNGTFMDGNMTLADVFLDGGAYAMDAKGGVNFATEETDILVYTRLLESLAKAVKWVPVLKQAVQAGTNQVGIAIQISGAPSEMQVDIVPGGSVTGAVVGIGGKAVKSIKKGVTSIIPGKKKNKEESKPLDE